MNWDTETDIFKLLDFAKPTKRKLTLFSVNCCKEILHLMTDQRSKDAVIAAELYADNKISKEELEIARTNAWGWNVYYAIDDGVNVKQIEKQIKILKDIINPFPQALNPNTLTYNDSIIPKLAKSIYNSQNYQDLPILADILEDAHEYNPLILNHLRSDQTHYKGCWVIDLLGEIA